MLKTMCAVLASTTLFSSLFTVSAAETTISENPVDEPNWTVDEGKFEEIEVTYKQASSYYVVIPKTIILDRTKQGKYSVKVSGDIDANQHVYVAPVDGIADTENIDFYMEDQALSNRKADVVANVTQNKIYWNSEDVTNGYEETNNIVSAPNLTAGTWRGIFQIEIRLESIAGHVHDYVDGVCTGCGEKDPNHEHSYVESITKEPTCTEAGEKKLTCSCGDTRTETIPAKGHNFVDGECTDCHEKDSGYHEHSYTEVITKEPTCTEAGEKTYTCDCGDNYTEEIPAKGHHYGDDDRCTDCGELNPDHIHSYIEKVTKEPTCTEMGEKTYSCDCGDSYTEEIPAKGHHYGDDDKCIDCGELNPDHVHDEDCAVCGHIHKYVNGKCNCGEIDPKHTHDVGANETCTICGHTHRFVDGKCDCGEVDPNHTHNYKETIEKEAICTDLGKKTYTCDCGDSFVEAIPAIGHNYVDGVCTNCGLKEIKVGSMETRKIAGKTLDFICVDEAYVDAAGEEKGALFIATSIISGTELSMGSSLWFDKSWSTNSVRSKLNGNTSDLSNLVSVDTTPYKAYSKVISGSYTMGSIGYYGTASDYYTSANTSDKVFILSLEEAIRYDKVTINGKNVFVMWDLNCDGTNDYASSSKGKYGYYLRTPKSGTSSSDKKCYAIKFGGTVVFASDTNYGIRPCYVKDAGSFSHEHSYDDGVITREATCTSAGERTYSCYCGDSYTEIIPAAGHSYDNPDRKCTVCGEVIAPAEAINGWNYTLSDGIVTLNYYIGSETDVVVYNNYEIDGKIYKTQLSNNKGNGSAYMFNGMNNCKNIESITFCRDIDTSNLTNIGAMFYNCSSLTYLDIRGFDTSNVTNMASMFNYCSSLKNLDVSSFDTGNVTNMSYMFAECSSLTDLDVSSFDTGKVTSMASMFQHCESLSILNISGLDTSNVTDMGHMFTSCSSLKNLDVSSFDTSKVTNMGNMFADCLSLTSLDVNNFDTSLVKFMPDMFNGCASLTVLDLSSFNTKRVTTMHQMFASCYNLKTIYITNGKWNEDLTGDAVYQMFANCGTSSFTYK